MPLPIFLAEQDSTRIYQIGRAGFDSGSLDSAASENSVDDDGSGVGAAPDEGLLVDGHIHRSADTYLLDLNDIIPVLKWYTTEFYSNNFEWSVDVKRGPDAANHGEPGIAFLLKDANNTCMITLEREDDDYVNIKFRRYDTGSDQSEVELEGDVALAYAGWIRLGVRVVSGVATAYRADAVTGANEASLGTLTIGASWISDNSYNLVGLVHHQASTAIGVAWDNLELNKLGPGSVYTGIIKSERITPFKDKVSGELGLFHARRIGVRILHTGGFTITMTVWVDGTQTQIYDSDSELINQTVEFTVAAPTASEPVEALLEADISAKGSYVEVQLSVASTGVTGVFLPESFEVHARPLRKARRGSDAESQ